MTMAVRPRWTGVTAIYTLRCIVCLKRGAALDAGGSVTPALQAGAEHVRTAHPGVNAAQALELEEGEVIAGWTSHPESPAAWMNSRWRPGF
ncbi:hypothetical protein ACFYN0_34730 [Streptomyces sp. NPDC006704]|uniref:hypothetical protein n=1 Tax=Streptomyces sp. NPDC006704 TaxID=3364760 RepID=UPI0036D03A1E